jgi:hypothetical protein
MQEIIYVVGAVSYPWCGGYPMQPLLTLPWFGTSRRKSAQGQERSIPLPGAFTRWLLSGRPAAADGRAQALPGISCSVPSLIMYFSDSAFSTRPVGSRNHVHVRPIPPGRLRNLSQTRNSDPVEVRSKCAWNRRTDNSTASTPPQNCSDRWNQMAYRRKRWKHNSRCQMTRQTQVDAPRRTSLREPSRYSLSVGASGKTSVA